MSRSLVIFFFTCCSLLPLIARQHDTTSGSVRMVGLSAGIGVDLVRITDINDYSNSISVSGNRVSEFAVGAEFFGAAEIYFNNSWGMKFEYAYLVNSAIIAAQPGYSDKLNYNVYMPTLLAQYVLPEKGYAFKFGGGLGYHAATVSIPSPIVLSQSNDYTSKGVGLKLEAEADTEFDQHFFGVITADVRDDIMSEAKDQNGQSLMIPNSGKHVALNFLSLGLKFGFIYYL